MEINALNELRDQVRKADREMAALFTERMAAVAKIAQYKSERGLPIEVKAQEARVIADRGPLVEDPDLRSFYVEFLQHIANCKACRSNPQRMLSDSRPGKVRLPVGLIQFF